MDISTFNYLEAFYWWAIGIVLFVKAKNQPSESKKIGHVFILFLFIFGITDLIEAQTGAWWEPLWLLIAKTTCVLGFIWAGVRYFMLRKTLS